MKCEVNGKNRSDIMGTHSSTNPYCAPLLGVSTSSPDPMASAARTTPGPMNLSFSRRFTGAFLVVANSHLQGRNMIHIVLDSSNRIARVPLRHLHHPGSTISTLRSLFPLLRASCPNLPRILSNALSSRFCFSCSDSSNNCR